MQNRLGRPNCLRDNFSARTTQKTRPLYCCRSVSSSPFHSNGRGAGHMENTVLLLLRALPSNGQCLQSHRLRTGLYATILSVINVTLYIISLRLKFFFKLLNLLLGPPIGHFPRELPTGTFCVFFESLLSSRSCSKTAGNLSLLYYYY
jgi:hypothetical protein